MFTELRELLQKDVVDITFISDNSHKEYTIPCTLMESLTSSRVNQQINDTIVCYRLDEKKWEDIRLNSIVSYRGSP
jgi:RNA-binding protein YhbY